MIDMSIAQVFKNFLYGKGVHFREEIDEEDTILKINHRYEDTGVMVDVSFVFQRNNTMAVCGIYGFGSLDDSPNSYRLLNDLNNSYVLGRFIRLRDGSLLAQNSRCVTELGLDCQALYFDALLLMQAVEDAIPKIMKAKWA